MIEERILEDMKTLREEAERTGIYYGFWNLLQDAEACVRGKRTILPPEKIDEKLRETITEIRERAKH